MKTMQAVWITRPGGPEVLEIREVPQPEAIADQVLVRVRASALNRADLLQRRLALHHDARLTVQLWPETQERLRRKLSCV